MDVCSFNTQDPAAPTTLAWGFVVIGQLRSVTARATCFVEGTGDDVAGLSFAERDAQPGVAALVQIKMYRLPAASAALAQDLQLAAGVERPWPIAEGWPFMPEMLAPTDAPAAWRHKAAQTFTVGPGIVHAYRGSARAMFVQYVLRTGDVLRYPLFRWAAENLRVIEPAWHLAPPVAMPAYADDEISPDDVGDGVAENVAENASDDVVDLAAETSDRPLDATERAQVARNAQRARDVFNVPASASAEEAIRAVHDAVHELRGAFRTFKPNVKHNMSVSLGSLWGEMLCKTIGWEWCGFTRTGVDEFLAIVSPDRAYVVSPNDFITDQLMQSDPDADNTVRLLFNMLRAGKLPPSEPGAYRLLG